MIKRYRHQGAVKYISAAFLTNTGTSSTASTSTSTTTFHGEPGAILTFQVTTLSHTNGGAVFKVDGATYILGNTFTYTLDSFGQGSFVEFVDVGTTTIGNAINAVLTITAASIGGVSGAGNTMSVSKTT